MAVLLPYMLYLYYTLYFPSVLCPCYFYLNIVSQLCIRPSCTLRVSGIRFPLGCNLFVNTLFESTRLKPCIFLIVPISLMSGT